MVMTHPVTGDVGCKIVYFGPAASGKTTSLKYAYRRLDPAARGKLIAPTDGPERTLFFDFLPVDMGVIHGSRTRFHLYTVRGQAPQRESRRRVLLGADGVVFVADSHPQRMVANAESLADLEGILAEAGTPLADLPLVLQYNKRDLEGATPVTEMEARLNEWGRPSFETVAIDGSGVLESLTAVSRQVIASLERA